MENDRQERQIGIMVRDVSRIAEALERIAQAISQPKETSIHDERVSALRRISDGCTRIDRILEKIHNDRFIRKEDIIEELGYLRNILLRQL